MSDGNIHHLLGCILVAFRIAEKDTPFKSERARRNFIANWLDNFRDQPKFLYLGDAFNAIRELLNTAKNSAVIAILTRMYELALIEKCELFRFRNALNSLRKKGWQHIVCRYPENITAALIDRREGHRRHVLQLTCTKAAFQPMGSMVLPVTLQLLFSKKHADQMHVESVFSTEGFQIVQDGRELNLTRERIVRTLHVGLPTLPTSEWSPKKGDIWQPDTSTTSK